MQPPPTDGELAAVLEKAIAESEPEAEGPLRVIGSTAHESGTTDYEVSVGRLVAVAPDDPELGDIYVVMPVTAHVSVAPGGAPVAALDEIDETTAREARAWANSLIASGSVAGIKASGPTLGPPRRPTHELVNDVNGRRVLRRIGFAIA